MKRFAVFFLLGALSLGCSIQAFSRTRASTLSESRASRKTNKQQKAMKKYAKAQRKAERKMLKMERKNTRSKHTIYSSE
jgi:hypothetical protein